MTRLLHWRPLWLLLVLIIGWPTAGFGRNFLSEFDLLPQGLEIHEDFKPGIGVPIGNISQITGRVVVIHMNQTTGYAATEGIPLFKNDTIVTLADAQAGLFFNDGSTVLLTPRTRLQVNQSVYSPRESRRAAFMDMAVGMARFVVKKISDVRQSDYNVKTHTTVVGARGSDFIVRVRPDLTEVSTMADTLLEIRSLALPDAPPVILRAFEQTVVRQGEKATEARRLEAQEVDRLVREFMFQPLVQTDTVDETPSVTGPEADAPLVDEKELLIPADMDAQRNIVQPPPAAAPAVRTQDRIGDIQETRRTITEQQLEQTVKESIIMSDFPARPDL